jgi:hypothetical protein
MGLAPQSCGRLELLALGQLSSFCYWACEHGITNDRVRIGASGAAAISSIRRLPGATEISCAHSLLNKPERRERFRNFQSGQQTSHASNHPISINNNSPGTEIGTGPAETLHS